MTKPRNWGNPEVPDVEWLDRQWFRHVTLVTLKVLNDNIPFQEILSRDYDATFGSQFEA